MNDVLNWMQGLAQMACASLPSVNYEDNRITCKHTYGLFGVLLHATKFKPIIHRKL